ncbi:hypothetical protein CN373_10975 [Bacillus cereus]|uniref:Pycsar effector protein domain-containing protein n=1 Tax=Bacillus cereus TaxID=1396 RepID=A0AA44TF87_BACCE|nr:Pycsar system effector family protein [Bacillus cereus]EEL48093.1 hypothetical protein bcere0022_47030 [Bacillus cereus Rock3-44]PFA22275.1 hypothetical protein CN373_10975 [Bacillus cereus]PFN06476.1 hypothetical protein COJ55_13910 [Bacillus cereus]PFR20052.1 hypothetical protein COK19_23440 [Bacillus cereus]PFS02932.1 hypothetical protein COK38_08300 [Bacillus cereus]
MKEIKEKASYEEMLQNVIDDGKVKIELHQREKSAKTTFVINLNNHLNNSLRFADTKAAALVAANGLITKFVMELGVKGYTVSAILLKIGLFSILVGILLSLVVVIPRSKQSKEKGIMYWDNIANMEKQEYTETVTSIPNDELFEKQIENNYHQAEILKVKFKRLRTAFLISIAGYCSLVPALVIILL